MSKLNAFAEFLRRIRAGDARAAAELVQRYEPVIRLEVRRRLRDTRLRRLFDSLDVCQSVLASFFIRAASGAYDLGGPEQLLKLLVQMTRNKLALLARRHRTQRRDHRRVEDSGLVELAVTPQPAPNQLVMTQELFHTVRQRLTAEERTLADLRAQEQSWAEIAAVLGGTPQARRMQLARAIKRVVRQLGLDEVTHA
jgi:RNA polymerase sigma-70 factor (ECF subfamily)